MTPDLPILLEVISMMEIQLFLVFMNVHVLVFKIIYQSIYQCSLKLQFKTRPEPETASGINAVDIIIGRNYFFYVVICLAEELFSFG
ncbi:hypothetical protein, partial [Leifsonia sp. SIMBA_070]|uniref:hypothetical protein n=1 Tax=Leifsonia sp. SIMBA_070 TaxID=3085810 RepID=UPI00397CDA08